MKKMILTVVLITAITFMLPAQNNDILLLQNKVAALENTNAKLNNQLKVNQKTIADLTNQLKAAQENMNSLQTEMLNTKTSLQEFTGTFESRIKQTEQTSSENFAHLGKSLSNNTLYWIIAFLVVAVASFLLYRQLRGRLSREKANIFDKIKTNGEELKSDFAELVAGRSEELMTVFSKDLKHTAEGLSNSISQSSEALRDELRAKLKLATEAFDEQKVNLENQIKALSNKAKKTTDKLHDAEA